MSEWRPKRYYDRGRKLKWGADLTPEQKAALDKGEVFTLLNAEGEPYSRVLKDSYGQIRERRVFHDALRTPDIAMAQGGAE